MHVQGYFQTLKEKFSITSGYSSFKPRIPVGSNKNTHWNCRGYNENSTSELKVCKNYLTNYWICYLFLILYKPCIWQRTFPWKSLLLFLFWSLCNHPLKQWEMVWLRYVNKIVLPLSTEIHNYNTNENRLKSKNNWKINTVQFEVLNSTYPTKTVTLDNEHFGILSSMVKSSHSKIV